MKNKQLVRCILTIVPLSTIVLSSIVTVPRFGKSVRTLYQLWRISAEVGRLERSAELAKPGENWSDDKIKSYNKLMDERNSIYNSSDAFVSKFSLSSNLTQVLILLGLFVTILVQFCALGLLLYMLAQYAIYIRKKIKRKKIKRAIRTSNN